MATRRQAAWTAEEDGLLAHIVLTHIRQGSTQLNAFRESGVKLDRTAAACGFRWNSCVRKQFHNEIALAKKERKQAPKNGPEMADELDITSCDQKEGTRLSFRDVIDYLNSLQEDQEDNTQSYSAVREENHLLRKRVKELSGQVEELKEEYRRLKKGYSSLVAFLEKARSLAAKETEYERST